LATEREPEQRIGNRLAGILKAGLTVLFKLLYRVEVRGLEHYRAAGERAIVVANHVSLLDAPLLATLLPGRPSFAINSRMAQCWWIRPWLSLVNAFQVDPQSPFAAIGIIRALRRGGRCIIFPEGRLTVTGGLMKIYDGPALVADRTHATVLPVRIDGAEFTPFSRLRGKVRTRWFPKITITVLPPRKLDLPHGLRGRRRRQMAGALLQDLMTDAAFEAARYRQSVFEAMLDARDRHGSRHPVIEDSGFQPMTYGRLIVGAMVLGRRLTRDTQPREHVGVLLPNAVGAVVTWCALQAFGRVPSMLNFTAGPLAVTQACAVAGVRTILTSRRFIEAARLQSLVAALEPIARLVYLDDLKADIGLGARIRGLIESRWSRALHRRFDVQPDDPAVILFTSGSEGQPKAVLLSHANLVANCWQVAARVDYTPADTMFNALPVFHSFGLTAGLVLPLVSGVKGFLYPSPLHYRVVPEMVYASNATMMFGTDTFLNAYARVAHPYDFRSIRYVFAGAEPLREETRRLWADKLGIRVFEGYGCTETAPVLAVNTPMFCRPGSVGRLLPGIRPRIEPVEGIAEGGRLLVAGPNIMLGYLRADRPGVLEPPEDGWHDTGDIATLDAQGYLRIVGRFRRFAKIAGEMVSLAAVEAMIGALWPDQRHAVIAVSDSRKGEQLVLVTERADAGRAAIVEHAHRMGAAELMVPRHVMVAEAIPVFTTGKTDYVGVKALVEQRRGGRHAA
jgi:acyl-[acyl-carrier-protein]-phospholipid O-acyltransferase/long-chain-fatty-acid--[acyl-carrier-protein] ligase